MLAKVAATIKTTELLRFEGVSYNDGDTRILGEVTLSLCVGAPTVLMGPNGSGKTTLLRLATRLVQPSAGAIYSVPLMRQAVVFQRPVMLRRSVAANVAFARQAAALSDNTATILSLLDRVGLLVLAHRPARKLSGGEQQRLAIARALAREPDILFLDEPTASLDPASTKAIEDVIATVAASGVKVVMSTHDIGQARRLAGNVVLMIQGRIAENAEAATFFNAPATAVALTRSRRWVPYVPALGR